MTFDQLSFAARLLNPLKDQPSVKVCERTMRAIVAPDSERLNNLFFQGRETVLQSRKDLMAIHRNELDLFTISVLYWGYPSNNWQRCSYAMNSWQELIPLVREIRYHRNMTDQYYRDLIPLMSDINNLGISTFSKLFYFAGATIDGKSCLIFDNMVLKGIGHLEGDIFDRLRNSVVGSDRYEAYLRYLDAIDELSGPRTIPPANIEYVLWLAGKKGL